MNITCKKMRRGQGGSVLLEALIGILIFSMGVLAIVGMQTASVKNSTESKYRIDANLLANQLIGQMWASDRTSSTLISNFQGGGGTDGASYTAWLPGARRALPNTATYPPVVSIQASGLVQITMRWKAPSDDAAALPHQHIVIAQIQ